MPCTCVSLHALTFNCVHILVFQRCFKRKKLNLTYFANLPIYRIIGLSENCFCNKSYFILIIQEANRKFMHSLIFYQRCDNQKHGG